MKVSKVALCFVICWWGTYNGCFSQAEPGLQITTPSGLKYQILKTGEGAMAKEGDQVKVAETVYYRDGTEVYSTKGKPNLPVFLIGGGQAIEGVDEGVRGMTIGEIRELVVPPSLSQRTQYPKFLSPDSVLIYNVELVEILQ